VTDGEVTQILDGIPENTPRVLPQQVTLDNIAGNYIILRIAPNRYVTYAHLQTGSIKVRLHDHVARGSVIARLGNSGQATGPHLHFQVTDGNSVLQSEGVPFIFGEFKDLGPGSDYETDKHPSTSRTDAIPGKDEVVDFTLLKKQ
jgi:murein DD-endopeptidase MepM/ murein hydrolase activator NlpD